MNHESNDNVGNRDSHPPLDAELEVRLTALALGEASDFEREQLLELIQDRHAVRAFYQKISALQNHMYAATSGETIVDENEWKLPPERRQALLDVIDSKSPWEPADVVQFQSIPETVLSIRRIGLALVKIAAVIMVAGFLGQWMWGRSGVQYALRAGTEKMVVTQDSLQSMDASLGPASSVEPPASPIVEIMDGAEVMDVFERSWEVDSSPKRRSSIRQSNETVEEKLSAGRDTHDLEREKMAVAGVVPSNGRTETLSEYYLQDEVRYSPADAVAELADGDVINGSDSRSSESLSITPVPGERDYPTVENLSVRAKDSNALEDRLALEPVLRQRGSLMLGVTPRIIIEEEEEAQIALMFGRIAGGKSPLPEQNAEQDPFSTFSLHVGDVSFKLAQSTLANGQWPEAERIRIEEFVNAFDYGDPLPAAGEKVACTLEQAADPFTQQRNLLRISMRTAAAGRAANTPLRLTCLLDNSGSMERPDRQQAVRQAFKILAGELKPIDQITLIRFARQPHLIVDQLSGDQSSQLVDLVDQMPSEGGTNFGVALTLAFEKAREQYADDAQNRVVLLTDGAVNLGDTKPASLTETITAMRDAGIAFDAAGVIADGLNDRVLESLTRQGDGRYYLIDSIESADDQFVKQVAGALRPSAKNVKVQVEFNPKRVGNYRLLGFEKHRLEKDDFHNDQVDAAEMAAAESGVAMYQFEAKPEGEGEVGSVSVRFEDLSTGAMIENRWPIVYQPNAMPLDQATPTMRLASAAAFAAMHLREDPSAESVSWESLSTLTSALPVRYQQSSRVQQLNQMIQQARQISGE